MTGMETAHVITIFANLVLEKGIPAAIAIMQAWQIDDPDADDIKALKSCIKRAEEY